MLNNGQYTTINAKTQTLGIDPANTFSVNSGNSNEVAKFSDNKIEFFQEEFTPADFKILRGLLNYYQQLDDDHPLKAEIQTSIALDNLTK